MRVNKRMQQIAAFGFGVVFVSILLILAISFSNPTPFQYLVFKTVLSLAAAGIAAMIPGFLQVNIATWLRAGGALAVFVVVYFYNPAQLLVIQPKLDSKVQLVDYSIEYPESDVLVPEIDVKLRNTGDQVAFIKRIVFDVLGEATFEDCNQPHYSLVEASAKYDVDILGSRSKEISHSIKPADVDRFKVRVFRPTGGPTLTVYKVALNVVYDEDSKVTTSSEPIFLKMVGPIVPLASTSGGVSEQEWNACVSRNRTAFGKIGYTVYEDDKKESKGPG